MDVRSATVTMGLFASANPTRSQVRNGPDVGSPTVTTVLQGTSKPVAAYCVRAVMATAGSVFDLDTADNDTVGDTSSWTAGVAQVETATAAGTVTLAGNVAVTVTAAGLTGSPLTIQVPVTLSDAAATWAGKVRTALAANAAIAAKFTVSGSSTAIVLTCKPTTYYGVDVYAASDGTLNIALANGSPNPGITAAATSTGTTAGTQTAGTFVLDGGGVDFEGKALPVLTTVQGYMIQIEGNETLISDGASITNRNLFPGTSILEFNPTGGFDGNPTFSFEASGPSVVTVTVIGS